MSEIREEKNASIPIDTLINLERATRIICQRYENSLRKYDGSINNEDNEFKKFDHFNKVRLKILDLLEKEINKWEF